jgi:hypothetical protein
MIEVIGCGTIESDDHVLQLARAYLRIVIPEDDELNLTHWWLLRDNGVETIYIGTIATFETFVKEQNGGLH